MKPLEGESEGVPSMPLDVDRVGLEVEEAATIVVSLSLNKNCVISLTASCTSQLDVASRFGSVIG